MGKGLLSGFVFRLARVSCVCFVSSKGSTAVGVTVGVVVVGVPYDRSRTPLRRASNDGGV